MLDQVNENPLPGSLQGASYYYQTLINIVCLRTDPAQCSQKVCKKSRKSGPIQKVMGCGPDAGYATPLEAAIFSSVLTSMDPVELGKEIANLNLGTTITSGIGGLASLLGYGDSKLGDPTYWGTAYLAIRDFKNKVFGPQSTKVARD